MNLSKSVDSIEDIENPSRHFTCSKLTIEALEFLTLDIFHTLRRWIPNPGVPCSKPLAGSKVDSAFHPSKVDKVSTRNFWEPSGKK